MTDTFTCALCGGVFEKGWTDEEAAAERAANGWTGTDCDVTCDDCFKLLMARRAADAQALNMTPEQLDVLLGASAPPPPLLPRCESMEQLQTALLTEWAAVLQVPLKYILNSREDA
jgi:hypothetical protein